MNAGYSPFWVRFFLPSQLARFLMVNSRRMLINRRSTTRSSTPSFVLVPPSPTIWSMWFAAYCKKTWRNGWAWCSTASMTSRNTPGSVISIGCRSFWKRSAHPGYPICVPTIFPTPRTKSPRVRRWFCMKRNFMIFNFDRFINSSFLHSFLFFFLSMCVSLSNSAMFFFFFKKISLESFDAKIGKQQQKKTYFAPRLIR